MRSLRLGRAVLGIWLGILVPAALEAQWAAAPDTTVRNEFGPQIGDGASACRGACGGGCHPNNCEPDSYWECVDSERFRVVRTYDCHTHEACRVHDDCLDRCAQRFPGTTRVPGEIPIRDLLLGWRPDRNFFLSECSTACHYEAVETYGLPETLNWKEGYESEKYPPDGRNVFEYTKDAPASEERLFRCPQGMELVCSGKGSCRKEPEEEEEPEEEPLDNSVVGVFVAPSSSCLAETEKLPMTARVVGLASSRVRWTIVEGPARIDDDGVLKPTGEGEVTVEAVSLEDPDYRDRATVTVGHCLCSFQGALAGDTGRSFVEGDWAVFSTRGQASIMGASAGGPEATEDLLNTLKVTQKLMAALGNQQAAEEQEQAIAELEETLAEQQEASTGSTLGINLLELQTGGGSGRNMGNAFKLDVLANGSIAPGFAGSLPVTQLAMHTGEFASQGLGPMMYTWEPGEPGSVTLTVYSYDGERLRGRVDADLTGLEGLLMPSGSRPKTRFFAEFDAGAFNPLRAENVCMMAQALGE